MLQFSVEVIPAVEVGNFDCGILKRGKMKKASQIAPYRPASEKAKAIIRIVSESPEIPRAELARRLALSRARVYAVLKSADIPTRVERSRNRLYCRYCHREIYTERFDHVCLHCRKGS